MIEAPDITVGEANRLTIVIYSAIAKQPSEDLGFAVGDGLMPDGLVLFALVVVVEVVVGKLGGLTDGDNPSRRAH